MVSFMECIITMYNLINGREKKHRFLCYTFETRGFHHDVYSFNDHNFLSSLDVILVIYFLFSGRFVGNLFHLGLCCASFLLHPEEYWHNTLSKSI